MLRPLKWYKSLLESKARSEEGCFLLDGRKNIDLVFQRAPELIQEILVEKSIESDCVKYNVPLRVLERHQMESVSPQKTPQGIIAVVTIPQSTYTSELPLHIDNRILLLENIQDPGNVGTLIRTAAAFNYSGVILSGQCADPYSPKVVQASAGCIFSVWIRRTSSYLECTNTLRKNGYTLFAADVHGKPGVNFSNYTKQIIALGSEGSGLTEELMSITDVRFSIPIESSNAESLNVAVCGGIVMFAGAFGIRLP